MLVFKRFGVKLLAEGVLIFLTLLLALGADIDIPLRAPRINTRKGENHHE